MALADPDLPPDIDLPHLSPEPPAGLDPDRYQRLRQAFDALPRRSRVVVVLRLPLPGRRPLTLRAIGDRLGIGSERVRQIDHLALVELSMAWEPSRATRVEPRDRAAELVPIVGRALDRYPIADPAEGDLAQGAVARGPRGTRASRVGAMVAYERKRQCKSMEDLAKAGGMHASQISLLERGLRDPRLSTLDRIASALGIRLGELVDGDPPAGGRS